MTYGLCALVDGLAWLPVAWAPSLPLAALGLTVSSVCGGYSVTQVVAWRMRVIPEPLVGRVFGVVKVVVLRGIFPGSLLGGWLADHVGTRQTIALSGFGFLAVALVAVASRRIREERR